MAGSLNRAELIGRLTKDPELRFIPPGAAVCSFSVATDRPFKKEGEQTADFHDVVVWNQGNRKLAELCNQYLKKGRLVYVEGRLQTRSWDDKETGAKRYRTEINATNVQFIDSRRDGDSPALAGGGEGGEAVSEEDSSGVTAEAALDVFDMGGEEIRPEDIPF